MGRHKLLKTEDVRKVVDEFLQDNHPTIAGLCRKLGVRSLHTLYKYMEEYDEEEIAELLIDAYMYIVETHEKLLFTNSPVAHIFYLKTVRKLGFNFRDSDPKTQETEPVNKIKIEIVD